MKAANNFVAIKTEVKESGFIVNEDNNIITGIVDSVGEDVKNIKKGDEVLFDTYKSIKFSNKGKSYWFTDYKMIFAKL